MTTLLLTSITDSLTQADTSLLLAINGQHNAFFDVFMYVATNKLVWIPLYLALLYVLFRNMSFKVAMICLACIAVAVGLADFTSSSVIRSAMARLRPANLENAIHDLVHIVNDYRGGRYGFPSSHAANTFCLCAFMFMLFRIRVVSFFLLLWSLLNCYTRLYLGVHYPGDILAGIILGTVFALLMYRVFVRITKYRGGRSMKQTLIPVSVGCVTLLCICAYSAVKVLAA